MRLLLDRRGNEVHITGRVVEAAARNEDCGNELMPLLLQHFIDEVKDEEVRNISISSYMVAVLEKYGFQFPGSDDYRFHGADERTENLVLEVEKGQETSSKGGMISASS